MPQFAYKARRRSGETVQGTVEAPDRAGALVQIDRQGLFPILVDAGKGAVAKAERAATAASAAAAAGSAPSGVTALLPPAIRELLQRKRRPKLQELATFTQQLANLLHSGMPLTVALNSMSHLESKGVPSAVSRQLRQDVMEGKGLSDAMSKQPHIFSDLFVNMVKAGEQSGALEDVLRRLATHYERFAEVQSKFSSALIYPSIVACVGLLIVIFFMTFMLPKFMTIFEGFKIPLPPATLFLIGISNFFRDYWWLLLLAFVAAIILFRRFQSSENGKRSIDRWKMNAPVLGKVVRLNLFAQFSRTLSTLLVNGVPVLNALKITEQIIPNRIIREAIAQTREDVTDGKTIAQPLAKCKLFPQLMIDLVKIGEETGDVPGALQSVAETYENELSIALRVMTNLIEPALIIVMAVGVGFLLFSVLSAMFAITSNIAR
jgi:type II secretory pathway component PulF